MNENKINKSEAYEMVGLYYDPLIELTNTIFDFYSLRKFPCEIIKNED